jgi:hypothetical protein
VRKMEAEKVASVWKTGEEGEEGKRGVKEG